MSRCSDCSFEPSGYLSDSGYFPSPLPLPPSVCVLSMLSFVDQSMSVYSQEQKHTKVWLCAHTVSVMVLNDSALLHLCASVDAVQRESRRCYHVGNRNDCSNDCSVWWWVHARSHILRNERWCARIYSGGTHQWVCGCVCMKCAPYFLHLLVDESHFQPHKCIRLANAWRKHLII